MKRKLRGMEEIIIEKMTIELVDVLSNFGKDRTIGSITYDEVKEVCKEKFQLLKKRGI